MFKKLGLLLVIAVLIGLSSIAQEDGGKQIMNQQITASVFNIYYLQYDGYPFFYEKWADGSIKITSGEIYDGLKIRLDIHRNNLVYYNEKLHKQLIIDNEIIDEIYMRNETGKLEFLIKNVCRQDSGRMNDCNLYFIHVSDSISLWSIQKKGVVQYNNSSATKKLGYYYQTAEYFKVIDGKRTAIPIHKRPLSKLFPANKRAILTYIKKNALDLKNYSDLSLVFIKINELEKANPSQYLK